MQPKVFELNDKNAKLWLIIVAIITAALIGIPMWTGAGDWYSNMHFLTLLLVFAMLNKRATRITVDADNLLIEYRTAIFFKETKQYTTAKLDVRMEGDTLHITDRKMKVLRVEKQKLKNEEAFEELALLLGVKAVSALQG